MFHCAILFRLEPGIPLDRVRGARSALQALVETLPGVEYFTVTHNLASADTGGFNLVLFAGFETQAACDIFLRHPAWLQVRDADLAPVVQRRLMALGTASSD